ncbi:PQ loop repeat-domain-containing protein [Colletotrichum acutatum]|uniref:PQ loop repeat-domain-containing protein n=1 Tax=Glomerella acutata TaxID=27357 RepID=A0AAD8UJZ0_GLOAC|nr:PQ loop repeat-domain-containing protein [Colletotrichum acutatum]KAK1722634.1 PQ loop repeat-domain-containing protein [Colletotrichum acutatum]
MAAVNLGQPALLSPGPISQDDASEILGSISMAAFLCLLIPQLAANYKLKSADSLSMAFLFIWLLGDVTNLLGGLANGIAPASIAVTTYLCFSDSTLICQCLYYNSKRRIQNLVQPSTPRSQSPERRPLLEPADSSEDVNSTGHYQVASPGSTQVVDKDEETDISTVRTLHDWRFNAACLVMVAILGISGWFLLRQLGLLGGEDPPGAVSVTELPGISESVGSALGVIGAICYLCARIPQIIKNYRGKSCEVSLRTSKTKSIYLPAFRG